MCEFRYEFFACDTEKAESNQGQTNTGLVRNVT